MAWALLPVFIVSFASLSAVVSRSPALTHTPSLPLSRPHTHPLSRCLSPVDFGSTASATAPFCMQPGCTRTDRASCAARCRQRWASRRTRHLVAPCQAILVTVYQHSNQAHTSPSHVCCVPTFVLRYLPDESQQSTLAAPEADPVWLHDDLPSAEVSD